MLKELIKTIKNKKDCNHKYVKESTQYGLDYSGFEWRKDSYICSQCGKKKTNKYLVRSFM